MNVLKNFVRVVMIALWLGIFGLFLFVPQMRFFRHVEKSIAILAWPTDIDPHVVADFERETGIKVYLSYFQDYGELFVKLRSSKGLGYDLVTPVDYIVKPMIEQGLLKPLDTSRCAFWSDLNPQLLDLYYDKGNRYTIPYFWGMFGIGINRDAFPGKEMPASWSLLFDTRVYDGPVGMLDDPKELVAIGAQYLFGSRKTGENLLSRRTLSERESGDNVSFDEASMQQVHNLLIEQKKRVVMYTDNRASYLLLSQTAPVVLTLSYEVARVMRFYKNIDFLIPQEGSFLLVDNWAMPASSTKDDLVYQFLNYMYRRDVLKRMVEQFLFYPPLLVDGVEAVSGLRLPTTVDMQRAEFIVSPVSESQLTDFWIALKA
jgi:spermidine/putrescine transport system substrate-binding protein